MSMYQGEHPVTSRDVFFSRLFLQGFFSTVVCFVCVYKIVTAPDTDASRAVYWATLTGITASWMPSPVLDTSSGEKPKAEESAIQEPKEK